jgi:menaquinone-dependent protoporphyrinogen oxidase
MRALVAYASRHGSTAGIAERIATGLIEAGFDVDVKSVDDTGPIEDYDAFVIGSAAYMFHWLKEATRFVKRHRTLLASKPVWLFSSGPLGTELVDDEGNDVLEASRPKEFDELEPMILPQGTKVFFGAWDPKGPPVGLAERMMAHVPAAKDALPAGDFRDWDAIDEWSSGIATALSLRV